MGNIGVWYGSSKAADLLAVNAQAGQWLSNPKCLVVQLRVLVANGWLDRSWTVNPLIVQLLSNYCLTTVKT